MMSDMTDRQVLRTLTRRMKFPLKKAVDGPLFVGQYDRRSLNALVRRGLGRIVGAGDTCRFLINARGKKIAAQLG